MDYIEGHYKRSIFTSNQGFTIGLFKVTKTNIPLMKDYINKTITFTGYFYDLNMEDTYILYGKVVTHPRYGMQFESESFEKVKPTGKDAVKDFFSSDLFPGVGEKLAESIVDTLGDEAIDKILEDPSCLNLVPKLTKMKADKIVFTLKKYDESHEAIVNLTNLGFSMKESLSIYNKYGNKSLKIVDENIYDLMEMNDMSFLKLDKLRDKVNIADDDKRRVRAGILYVMSMIVYQNGDCYLDKEKIGYNLNKLFNLNLSEEVIDEAFEFLNDSDMIVISDDKYYLKEIWDAQEHIVNRLYSLSNLESKKKDLDMLLENMEEIYGIKYNDEQLKAIKKAINENLLIITGGPGTGKTTIIKAICELYGKVNKFSKEQLDKYLVLLAPTGRASKRMSEATGMSAYTIHRFLKWNKDSLEFLINEENRSEAKMVIVDEVSMIDINLFDSLLKGIKPNTKIVLVGDYNQLPSVGPGQLLKDLIMSDCIDMVNLSHLYRQDENSYISQLALDIKENELDERCLETYSDYTFLKCSSQYIKKNLKQLCAKITSKGFDYKEVQVLAPMYKGENGIDLINKELQEIFNPSSDLKREIKYGDVIFREGDKILQLVNRPDDNIFNGDIGVIKYIKYGNTSKSGKNELYIDFDGNIVKYTQKDFNDIKHGYIISIHKSQGSEFKVVVLIMCHSYYRMLYKKLVYTAITRAKKKLILIGEPDAFLQSISDGRENLRNSELLEKIVYKFTTLGAR